jgi:hypothetical protein
MYNAERRQQLQTLFLSFSRRRTRPAAPRAPWLRAFTEGLAGLGTLRVTPATWPEPERRYEQRAARDW